MSETEEQARERCQAEVRRVLTLPPLEREREEKKREQQLYDLEHDFSEPDPRTSDEILAAGTTPASRRERAESDAREAPGKAAAAKAEADRRAASDASMEKHKPRASKEFQYDYMETEGFPKQGS